MSSFDDIRPYEDAEVAPTLARLLQDAEFLDTLSRLKLPRLPAVLRQLVRPLVRWRLSQEVKNIQTVADFQARVAYYLDKLMAKTVTHFTVSGLDQLDKTAAYCFVSNHRDIAMDPALVNWALFNAGFTTLRIAIGDNLLTKPFASDIMRLNKSFIVNRSATAPREKLKAAKHLSEYIQHSLLQDTSNIWIAQREGRAKDNLDKTNPAIISMLCLSKEKGENLGDYIARLRIVPVSISYEYDPCDQAKARELTIKAQTGSYKKGSQEDVQSIAMGLSGFKGAVHINFGQPLGNAFASVEEVAAYLDRVIVQQSILQPTNALAYELLEGHKPDCHVGYQQQSYLTLDTTALRSQFEARSQQCPAEYRALWLKHYANPVYAQLALATADAG